MSYFRGPVLLIATLSMAVGLTACSSGSSKTPTQQMQEWVKQTGFTQALGGTRSDLQNANEVVSRGATPAEAHTVCGVLLVGIEASNTELPTPDQTATNLIGKAYETLGAAAHECYDSSGNPAKLAAFQRDRLAGLAELSEGQLRVESVLGAPLIVTTTTLRPAGS